MVKAELQQQVDLHPGLPPRPLAETVPWTAQRVTETGHAGGCALQLVRGDGVCHRLRRWGTRESWCRLQQLPQVGDDPTLPWPGLLAQPLVGQQVCTALGAEPGAAAGTVAWPAPSRKGHRLLLARTTATPQAPLMANTGGDWVELPQQRIIERVLCGHTLIKTGRAPAEHWGEHVPVGQDVAPCQQRQEAQIAAPRQHFQPEIGRASCR